MQKSFFLLLFSLLLISCNEETTSLENEKILAKNKQTFNLINSLWNLAIPNPTATVKKDIANWNEWQQLVIELQQKPKSNLTAFQLKTKNISGKIDSLGYNIPDKYNNPAVKSRIASLSSKIKMLDNYLNISDVPEKKIRTILPEINNEIISLVNQLEEVILKNLIPVEEGESYLLKAKDTFRNANAFEMIKKMNQLQDSAKIRLKNKKNK